MNVRTLLKKFFVLCDEKTSRGLNVVYKIVTVTSDISGHSPFNCEKKKGVGCRLLNFYVSGTPQT